MAEAWKAQAINADCICTDEKFALYTPKSYFWIGFICTVLFLSATILLIRLQNEACKWWVYMISVLFVLSGLFLVYYSYRWKIEVSGDTIVYTPLFGKKRMFLISRITGLKSSSSGNIMDYHVYVNGKKAFKFDETTIGCSTFIKYVHNRNVRIDY